MKIGQNHPQDGAYNQLSDKTKLFVEDAWEWISKNELIEFTI